MQMRSWLALVDNSESQPPKSPQYNYNDAYSQDTQQHYQPYDSNTTNERSYDVNTSQYPNPYDTGYTMDNKYDGYGNTEENENPDYPCTVFVGDLGDFTDEAELGMFSHAPTDHQTGLLEGLVR